MAKAPQIRNSKEQLRLLFSQLAGQDVTADTGAADEISDAYLLLEHYQLSERDLIAIWEQNEKLHRENGGPFADQWEWLEKFDRKRSEFNTDHKLADIKLANNPDFNLLYPYYTERKRALPPPYVKPKAPSKPVAAEPIELVIEPKLQGAPQKQLDRWKTATEEHIRSMNSDTVEYFIRSPKPLLQYDKILIPYATVTGRDGKPWHQYRLSGPNLNDAVSNRYTASVPFHKFDPQKDSFPLFQDDKRTHFGLGIVRLSKIDKDTRRKDTTALVIRTHNGGVREMLREAGFMPRADEVVDPGYRVKIEENFGFGGIKTVAVVHPIPDVLAGSIRRAHRLPPEEKAHDVPQLMERCWNDAELFAPPQEKIKRIAQVRVKRSRAPVAAATEEEMLRDVLDVYGAELTGRRGGSGAIEYRLSLARKADWSKLPERSAPAQDALKKHFLSTTKLNDALSEQLGFKLLHQDGEVPYLTIQAGIGGRAEMEKRISALRTFLGVTEVPVAPFVFGASMVKQSENRMSFPDTKMAKLGARIKITEQEKQKRAEAAQSRAVHYYLMPEAEPPCLVAVADARKFGYANTREQSTTLDQLFERMGLPKKIMQQAVFSRLKTENGSDHASNYAVRVPLHPDIFRDIAAAGQFPLLKAHNEATLLDELGACADDRTVPLAAAIALVRTQSKPVAPASAQKSESTEEREARLAATLTKTMDGLQRITSEFYIARRMVDGQPVPYAYAILHGNEAARLAKELPDVQFATRAMHTRTDKKRRWQVMEVRLSPEEYERLRARDIATRKVDPERDSRQLAHVLKDLALDADPVLPDATIHDTLKEWMLEAFQAEVAKDSKPGTMHVSAKAALISAAQHPNGRLITTQLREPAWFAQEIATLEKELARQKEQKTHISGDHKVLKGHVASAGMLMADTVHAQGAFQSAQLTASQQDATIDHLKKQIAKLKALHALSQQNGGVVHGVALRGARSRLGSIETLIKSVDNPGLTVEGASEAAQHLMYAKEIGLGRGHKTEKKAIILLAAPALWAKVAPEIAPLVQDKDKHLPGRPGFHDIDRAVGEMYEPNHFKSDSPDIAQAFEKLGRQALIVKRSQGRNATEGKGWAEGDKGAQNHLYIVVGKDDRDKALQLLKALSAEDAIAGEKSAGQIVERATGDSRMIEFKSRQAALGDASKIALGVDGMVARAVKSLQEGTDRLEDLRFSAGKLRDYLSAPKMALVKGLEGKTRSLMDEEILPAMASELQRLAKEPELIPLLEQIAETGALPPHWEQSEAMHALSKIPSVSDTVQAHGDATEEEFSRYVKAHPKAAEPMKGGAEFWSLHLYDFTVAEAQATHTVPQVTLSQNGKQTATAWRNSKEDVAAMKDKLRAATEDAPVILSLPLNEETAKLLSPLRSSVRGAYLSHAKEGADRSARKGTTNAGRQLDGMASTDRAYGHDDVVKQLSHYFDLPQSAVAAKR